MLLVCKRKYRHASLWIGYGLRKNGWFQSIDIEDLGFVELSKADASGGEVYSSAADRGYGICKGAKNLVGASYILRYFLDANNYEEEELYKNEECVLPW